MNSQRLLGAELTEWLQAEKQGDNQPGNEKLCSALVQMNWLHWLALQSSLIDIRNATVYSASYFSHLSLELSLCFLSSLLENVSLSQVC